MLDLLGFTEMSKLSKMFQDLKDVMKIPPWCVPFCFSKRLVQPLVVDPPQFNCQLW